ncbi:hypothetical protein F4604DRAFT_1686648 [Suillus subluteus]|nr:hypothetical protein F4604DRAFT_1686648 [Suillus subluteus]
MSWIISLLPSASLGRSCQKLAPLLCNSIVFAWQQKAPWASGWSRLPLKKVQCIISISGSSRDPVLCETVQDLLNSPLILDRDSVTIDYNQLISLERWMVGGDGTVVLSYRNFSWPRQHVGIYFLHTNGKSILLWMFILSESLSFACSSNLLVAAFLLYYWRCSIVILECLLYAICTLLAFGLTLRLEQALPYRRD